MKLDKLICCDEWTEGTPIKYSDIVDWDDRAYNVSMAGDDEQERWRQYATLKDGRKVAIVWIFPDEVLRDDDGDRFEDDSLLPWDDLDYIAYYYPVEEE